MENLKKYFNVASNLKPNEFDASMDTFYDDLDEKPLRFKRELNPFISNKEIGRHKRHPLTLGLERKPLTINRHPNLFTETGSSNSIIQKPNPQFVYSADRSEKFLQSTKSDLKEHLETIREKLEARKRKIDEKHGELVDKIENARASIQQFKRYPRSLSNKNYKEIPSRNKLQNFIIKSYNSKTTNLKQWKPEDILKLGKKQTQTSTTNEHQQSNFNARNRRSTFDIKYSDMYLPKLKSPNQLIKEKGKRNLQQIDHNKNRIKRNILEDLDSIENKIDYVRNEIENTSKPAEEEENYTIELKENVETTSVTETVASDESYTNSNCTDDVSTIPFQNEDDHPKSHIQKIYYSPPSILDRILGTIQDLMHNLKKSMSSTIFIVD